MEMLNPEAAQNAALKLCAGHYQTALVYGLQNIAVSDLAGKASKYGGLYKKSRDNLFERIWWSGIPFSTVKPVKGPVKLVWGSDAIDVELALAGYKDFQGWRGCRLSGMPIWSTKEVFDWLASAPKNNLPDRYKPVVAKYVLENLKV